MGGEHPDEQVDVVAEHVVFGEPCVEVAADRLPREVTVDQGAGADHPAFQGFVSCSFVPGGRHVAGDSPGLVQVEQFPVVGEDEVVVLHVDDGFAFLLEGG